MPSDKISRRVVINEIVRIQMVFDSHINSFFNNQFLIRMGDLMPDDSYPGFPVLIRVSKNVMGTLNQDIYSHVFPFLNTMR